MAMAILDLGCGTGLCGTAVKSLASRIDGVDLSAPMLEKARELGIYDQLEESDIIQYLYRCENQYDTVIAGGLLEHIGDPVPLFTAAAFALNPRGAFIVTAVDNRNDLVEVDDSCFYTHNETVLRDAAAKTSLTTESIKRVILRKDANNDVHGLLASFTHP